jgi:peptidoglycan L-alanyl-D-glutamate endopeptidase CwlK
MASRSLEDLTPECRALALEHIRRCKVAGVELLIYCTLRTPEEQAELFARGRTREQLAERAADLHRRGRPDLGDLLYYQPADPHGTRVTLAGPGESLHQYGLAYDAAPIAGGKIDWSGRDWQWGVMGEMGELAGLEWAGRWPRFREQPHFQIRGRSVAELSGGW